MLRDRIQKQVYPKRHNTATILNYLEELVLISAKEVGRVTIEECKGGYQDVLLSNNRVRSLTVPDGAVSAIIQVELACDNQGEGEGSFSRVKKTKPISECGNPIRYKENGSNPSKNSGFSLKVGDFYNSIGSENLKKFRVLRIDSQKEYYLRIQYFKTAQTL